jgi:hypothetical protein
MMLRPFHTPEPGQIRDILDTRTTLQTELLQEGTMPRQGTYCGSRKFGTIVQGKLAQMNLLGSTAPLAGRRDHPHMNVRIGNLVKILQDKVLQTSEGGKIVIGTELVANGPNRQGSWGIGEQHIRQGLARLPCRLRGGRRPGKCLVGTRDKGSRLDRLVTRFLFGDMLPTMREHGHATDVVQTKKRQGVLEDVRLQWRKGIQDFGRTPESPDSSTRDTPSERTTRSENGQRRCPRRPCSQQRGRKLDRNLQKGRLPRGGGSPRRRDTFASLRRLVFPVKKASLSGGAVVFAVIFFPNRGLFVRCAANLIVDFGGFAFTGEG